MRLVLPRIVQYVALLLAQRIADGEHALDEATTGKAVRTEAGVAPQYTVTQGAFGGVVGRLDTFLADEGPQGRFDLTQVGARSRRLSIGAELAIPQLEADLMPQFVDINLKAGAL